MTEEQEMIIGPIIYAILKGVKAYKMAYEEAVTEYKNLTGKNVEFNIDPLLKIFNSVSGEMEKFSDLGVQDFLKNYQKFETIFSIAKKLLG